MAYYQQELQKAKFLLGLESLIDKLKSSEVPEKPSDLEGFKQVNNDFAKLIKEWKQYLEEIQPKPVPDSR